MIPKCDSLFRTFRFWLRQIQIARLEKAREAAIPVVVPKLRQEGFFKLLQPIRGKGIFGAFAVAEKTKIAVGRAEKQHDAASLRAFSHRVGVIDAISRLVDACFIDIAVIVHGDDVHTDAVFCSRFRRLFLQLQILLIRQKPGGIRDGIELRLGCSCTRR